jgi:hypothetical protein
MGWHSTITSDQEITEELLTSILQAAPETLKLDPTRIDNLGRCLMATDVSLKDKNNIRIGGSWSMSGHQAEPMRAYIKQQLKSRGHKVRSTKPQ